MENSQIEWTDHTHNWWWGCTKVSPGCDHCYAEALAQRMGCSVWGSRAPRKPMSDTYWRQPLRWNRQAEARGQHALVFCGSMMDWCDPSGIASERKRGWDTIRTTPHLDWLMLTKRPELMSRYLPGDWADEDGNPNYPNVWLGCSIESADYLYRLKSLIQVPAVIHFISYEPALGPLHLRSSPLARWLDWVIIGGESGPSARPFDLVWTDETIIDCRWLSIAPFVKQLGSMWAMQNGDADRKGGNMARWPDRLQIREFPIMTMSG